MPTSRDEHLQKRTYTLDEAERALTLPKVWWAYAAVLPAAKRLSLWLANRTRLTPNQITLISFALVMLSAALFYQGSWPALAAGGVIYQLNYLLDCVDGAIARLKNKKSIEGSFLDFFSDRWKNFIALFALSYGHYLRHYDVAILLVAICYVFLSEMYVLRDAKVDYMLRANKMVFFTAPSPLVIRFAPARRFLRWMGRAKLYNRPTDVDVWALVFLAGPLLNRVYPGILAGAAVLFLLFIHQTIRFFVLTKRARKMIRRLKSPEVISIALFGTGAMAERFDDWAIENGIGRKIIFAVDNDPKKWGEKAFGLEISRPQRLKRHEFNIIIVASQHGYYEIALQLHDMKFKPWRDFAGLAFS